MVSLEDLQRLAGIRTQGYGNSLRRTAEGSNISITGTEKAELQRQHNIQPLQLNRPHRTHQKTVRFQYRSQVKRLFPSTAATMCYGS